MKLTKKNMKYLAKKFLWMTSPVVMFTIREIRNYRKNMKDKETEDDDGEILVTVDNKVVKTKIVDYEVIKEE